MQTNVILASIGATLLFFIILLIIRAKASVGGYRAEVDDILNKDEHKVKGRYEQ